LLQRRGKAEGRPADAERHKPETRPVKLDAPAAGRGRGVAARRAHGRGGAAARRAMKGRERAGSGADSAVRASADAQSDASDRVRVTVRARPLVPTEKAARAKEAVFVAADGRSILVGRERSFQFDAAFGKVATQESIYLDSVAPLVEGCFAGARRCGGAHRRPRRGSARGAQPMRGGG
jgi:hypothetical protein